MKRSSTDQRIEKIALRRFRGATTTTEIHFDKQKPLIFIFGENGTGKSSIVDAIDFVLNSSAGSLEDRRLTTKAKDYLPALGHTTKDLQVELIIGGQLLSGKYAGAKIQVNSEAILPTAHVLRRSRLLNLIEASAAEKYKQLQTFIDVEAVEKSEQTLRDALNDAKRTLEEKSVALTNAEAELEKLWQVEGAPGDSSVDWASEKCSVKPERAAAAARQLQTVLAKLDAATQARTDHQKDEAQAAQRQAELVACQVEATTASVSASEGLEMIGLLRDAKNYLSASQDLPACPVCQQPVVADELRRKIDDRLNRMTNLGQLRDRLDTAERAYQKAADIAEKSKTILANVADVLAGVIAKADLPSLKQFDTTDAKRLLDLGTAARGALATELGERQKDVNQFTAIQVLYERVRDTNREVHASEALAKGLERALELVHSKRIAFTQQILDSVRDECNRLYSAIHPDEPLALDKLYLDENRKASLEQRCSFEGQAEVMPQAYFSESHLDTLGFCLWLSVAKLTTGGNSVIVLDDVFTSVDNVHFTRILDLLITESENFNQVIVTTHQRQWRDRYASQQIPHKISHFVELQSWSRVQGIKSVRTKPDVALLREHLEAVPFDRQIVGSKAGVIAESLLDWLAEVYQCSLPYRRSRQYALGELTNGVGGLSKKLKIKCPAVLSQNTTEESRVEELEMKPLLDTIANQTWIRNQVGAHFNLSGADIADVDVKKFGQSVLALAEALVCLSCGGVAHRKKDSFWTCACGKIQMTPLVM